MATDSSDYTAITLAFFLSGAIVRTMVTLELVEPHSVVQPIIIFTTCLTAFAINRHITPDDPDVTRPPPPDIPTYAFERAMEFVKRSLEVVLAPVTVSALGVVILRNWRVLLIPLVHALHMIAISVSFAMRNLQLLWLRISNSFTEMLTAIPNAYISVFLKEFFSTTPHVIRYGWSVLSMAFWQWLTLFTVPCLMISGRDAFNSSLLMVMYDKIDDFDRDLATAQSKRALRKGRDVDDPEGGGVAEKVEAEPDVTVYMPLYTEPFSGQYKRQMEMKSELRYLGPNGNILAYVDSIADYGHTIENTLATGKVAAKKVGTAYLGWVYDYIVAVVAGFVIYSVIVYDVRRRNALPPTADQQNTYETKVMRRYQAGLLLCATYAALSIFSLEDVKSVFMKR